MRECLDEVLTREASSDRDPAIGVIIVYEDFHCGLRAMQLYERLTKSFAHDCRFQLNLWKCDILGLPPVAEFAADAAASADLVMISLDRDAKISSKLKTWIEEWAARKTSTDVALVVLVNRAGDSPGGLNSAGGYLRDVARRGGMKFFADSAETSCDAEENLVEGEPHPVRKSVSPLETMAYERNAYAHWGLNE